jgi:transcriptional regulator with XRE-family HTH domain
MLSLIGAMSPQQPSDFGVLVRQLRDARRWTQEKLAREADLTVTSVSNVERGATKPNAETVEKIAAAFGLEPGDLDPRHLATAVAEQAQGLAKRQAIGLLLAASDDEIDAILQLLKQRASKGTRRRAK